MTEDIKDKTASISELNQETEKRKKAEHDLQQSEQKLWQILRSSSIPTFVIDNEHVVTHWNKACEKLTGIPADQVIGTKKQWNAFYPAQRPVMADLVVGNASEQEILRYYGDKASTCAYMEKAYEAEDFFHHLGEKGKWLFFTAAPLTDDDGKTIGAVETLQDITERKRAEETLRKSQAEVRKLALVASRTGSAVIITDSQGRIEWTNDGFTRITEYEPEEVLSKKPSSILTGEETDRRTIQRMSQHLSNGEPVKAEILNYTKSGRKIWLDVEVLPIRDESDNVTNFIAIENDITFHKYAEQQQAELLVQLQTVNKELKDFAYIISHDLKAPLRGIQTLADWIVTDYADKLDNEGKEHLNLLLSRVDRMQNLIDGILQYSRIGRIQEEIIKIDLNQIVTEVIDLLAPPENITVSVENELPVIECERVRIIQVFQNLLSNAIKYVDKPQGKIRIGCIEEDSFWKLHVADNGPGIEEKHFEKIFQMFQTLTPRDRSASTGIGLTIVKKIIGTYGGKIWVESKVGQGSTFYFTLPKQEIGVNGEKPRISVVA